MFQMRKSRNKGRGAWNITPGPFKKKKKSWVPRPQCQKGHSTKNLRSLEQARKMPENKLTNSG